MREKGLREAAISLLDRKVLGNINITTVLESFLHVHLNISIGSRCSYQDYGYQSVALFSSRLLIPIVRRTILTDGPLAKREESDDCPNPTVSIPSIN